MGKAFQFAWMHSPTNQSWGGKGFQLRGLRLCEGFNAGLGWIRGNNLQVPLFTQT